jgi:hypothetical protein
VTQEIVFKFYLYELDASKNWMSEQRNCFSLNVFVLLDYDFGRLTEAT